MDKPCKKCGRILDESDAGLIYQEMNEAGEITGSETLWRRPREEVGICDACLLKRLAALFDSSPRLIREQGDEQGEYKWTMTR